MKELENEVFGEHDEKLAVFVTKVWTVLVQWAEGIMQASIALDKRESTDETEQMVIEAGGTALGIFFASTMFQNKAPNWTNGELYEELFRYQELLYPEIARWYEKFGEHGIWVKTDNGLTFHDDLLKSINGFLNISK